MLTNITSHKMHGNLDLASKERKDMSLRTYRGPKAPQLADDEAKMLTNAPPMIFFFLKGLQSFKIS